MWRAQPCLSSALPATALPPGSSVSFLRQSAEGTLQGPACILHPCQLGYLQLWPALGVVQEEGVGGCTILSCQGRKSSSHVSQSRNFTALGRMWCSPPLPLPPALIPLATCVQMAGMGLGALQVQGQASRSA